MAHTKAKATTKNNRDSRPKYLGVKLHSGQIVKPGDIIVRQRGTRFVAGLGTKQGNDDTIFSTQNGRIEFISKNKIKFDGRRKILKFVKVVPAETSGI